MHNDPPIELPAALRRRLGLPLLVLYGTGITVGAGIYVLIGAVAGYAGVYAPWSFVLAAAAMAFTVASYAELSTRFPVSAGEAAYVKAAFQSRLLARLTGLLTIAIGVVCSSAVAVGSAGYIQQFIDLPQGVIVVAVIVMLGAVASWGILESVLLASVFTLIEVGGLLAIIVAAAHADLPILSPLVQPLPLEAATLSGIAFASLLAFFAFVGFEDLANVVEEAKVPHRDIPRAMVLTLLISTILYVAVVGIAISAVPAHLLASSPAPLSLVFRQVAGVSPATISAIAIVATLNTILAQMTMAARVIYGMARQGDLPGHRRTCASADGDAGLRHGAHRGAGERLGTDDFVRAAGRDDLPGNACGVCAGQSGVAAASPPAGSVEWTACERAGLGPRRRFGDLPRHDRSRTGEMSFV